MTRQPVGAHNTLHYFGGQDPGIDNWIYVLPLAPAATPSDYVASDVSPSFQNSWGNVAGLQAMRFGITLGLHVYFEGAIDGGAIPSVVFTLPEHYRPQKTTPILLATSVSSELLTGRVDTNGDVSILSIIASNSSIYFEKYNIGQWFSLEADSASPINGYSIKFLSHRGQTYVDDSPGGGFFWQDLAGGGYYFDDPQGGGFTLDSRNHGGAYFNIYDSGGFYVNERGGGGIGLDEYGGGGIFIYEEDGGGIFIQDPQCGGIWIDSATSGTAGGGEIRISNYGNGADGGIFIGNRASGGGDGNGQLELRNEGTGDILLNVAGGGYIVLAGLPTTNPGGTNRVWRDSGTLKIT